MLYNMKFFMFLQYTKAFSEQYMLLFKIFLFQLDFLFSFLKNNVMNHGVSKCLPKYDWRRYLDTIAYIRIHKP